jgi:hypothetical protein
MSRERAVSTTQMVLAVTGLVQLLASGSLANNPVAALPAAPTPTAPIPWTATPTTQATATPGPTEIVSHKDLASHFERVTTLLLRALTFFVAASAGVGLYFGVKGWKDLRDLGEKIAGFQAKQRELSGKLEKAAAQVEAMANWLRYVREIRDLNPDLRMRAVQQVAESNDMAAVSILVEASETEKDEAVLVEILYGIGVLLGRSAEEGSLQQGTRALVRALADTRPSVRMQSAMSLHDIMLSGANVSQMAMHTLQALAENKAEIASVRAAAQGAVGARRQLREKGKPSLPSDEKQVPEAGPLAETADQERMPQAPEPEYGGEDQE